MPKYIVGSWREKFADTLAVAEVEPRGKKGKEA